jgi:hypothetical protein
MFAKLKNNFVTPLYTTVEGLESFAGLGGKGVYHKKIWSPDVEQIYSVIPKRFWDDFELTVMTINSMLLPHIDNDLISTINFYIRTDNCRTVFYKPKNNADSFQVTVDIQRPKSAIETDEEVKMVKAIYDLVDVDEVASFLAQPNEAWLLDVREIHNVEPMGEFTLRKAIALRTAKYGYDEVCEMLKETGNL